MPATGTPPPQHLPSARELDDVALMALGVLDPAAGFGPAGSPVTLTVPEQVWQEGSTDELELIDPEGAPVARMTVRSATPHVAPDGGQPQVEASAPRGAEMTLAGPVQTLPSAAAGVFARLHRRPEDVRATSSPQRLTVPVDHPLSTADLELVETEAGGAPVLLLALAGDRMPVGCSGPGLVRATLAAAELLRPRVPGEVVAVPLARREEPANAILTERVVSAYAPGPVLRVDQGGELPETVAAEVARDRPAGDRRGAVVFFTGLSGSGKSTLARALRDHVVESGARTVSLLDGDVVRRHLSSGLTFSPADRETNIRRIGWVAAEIGRHGGLAICSPIAPFGATRREVRAMATDAHAEFVLVHVATPLAECERRDRKGLYARARRGEIPDFTGISSPYEEPRDAEVVVDTTGRGVEEALEPVLAQLRQRELLPGAAPAPEGSEGEA